MNSHYSSRSNSDFPSPHLKLIYYLFDHDYTISSKSVNAIVKVGLKTKNKELIKLLNIAIYQINELHHSTSLYITKHPLKLHAEMYLLTLLNI